ncbi:CpsD/CapB family tyrosine-protein kinase [Metabacillus indicus]|uniref:CpsD/CapB family tyrosine-protein kinase n=1 Tax=Metabacillus indicus TaxID=246786 RepID=UPI002493556F|nr:CpsD/CapB family tyrosine-protein kinase [Metabacillus indicus]
MFNHNSSRAKSVLLDQSLVSSEQIRMIRMNVENTLKNEPVILLVTSPSSNDGDAMVASKLAIAFTEQEKKVLLVDANLSEPAVHALFNLENTSGLADAAYYGRRGETGIMRTFIENLSILPAGSVKGNFSGVIISSRFKELVKKWTSEYDVVLIDAPGFLEKSDAQLAAECSDGVVLVVKANKTKKRNLYKTTNFLDRAKKRVVGVIYQTG